jgi:NAD(P)-dependent dehydrogenase (short-subunit alcohol dehydrogenase family)
MPASPDLPTVYPELHAARAGWRYRPAADCLADRVILVTGAGDGIGCAAAKTFATYGAHVILLGRTRSKLEGVFDWITTHTDTRPVIVPCDLEGLGEENSAALVDAVDGEFGRLDGLLHNASLLGPRVPVAHYPNHEWQRVMQVNVNAAFLLTRDLLPLLEASGDASVVFTSSSVGRQGRAYWGAYAVSKFATEGLCQVLADEHEHAGRIRFNSLNPGATRTGMRAAAYPAENPATLATAEDKLDVYLYLFEPASRGLNAAALDARDWSGPAGT